MTSIVTGVIVAIVCLTIGWYAGVESAKYHIIEMLVKGKENLSEQENAMLVELLSRVVGIPDNE